MASANTLCRRLEWLHELRNSVRPDFPRMDEPPSCGCGPLDDSEAARFSWCPGNDSHL